MTEHIIDKKISKITLKRKNKKEFGNHKFNRKRKGEKVQV